MPRGIYKHKKGYKCDGCYYHACKQCGHTKYFQDAIDKDRNKTKQLQSAGHIVYRFWGHEIEKSVRNCFDKIKNL